MMFEGIFAHLMRNSAMTLILSTSLFLVACSADDEAEEDDGSAVVSTPTSTASPEPSTTPSPSPSIQPSPEPTAEPSPSPEPTVTATPVPNQTSTPEPAPTMTPSPAPTPEATASPSPTPVPTASPSPTPEPTASPSPTPEPTATPTPEPVDNNPDDLSIVAAEASTSQTENGYTPDNVFDNNFESESRWSGLGVGATLDVDMGSTKTFNAIEITFLNGSDRSSCFNLLISDDKQNWNPIRSFLRSSGSTSSAETFYIEESDARYVRYEGFGNTENEWNSLVEVEIVRETDAADEVIDDGDFFDTCAESNTGNGDDGGSDDGGSDGGSTGGLVIEDNADPFVVRSDLDPSAEPAENFDLTYWKITYPDASEEYPPAVVADEFYTGNDGAMVFRCVNEGEQTSDQTQYPRSELREMLRGTNSGIGTRSLGNNWVISSTSQDRQEDAGGINGNMKATLSVDYVSRDYDEERMVGRVVVGQIHGADDEPIKIYYRKLPQNELGSIYFSYEEPGDDGGEDYYEIIGSRSTDASNPSDGIALGEKWSYEIDVVGRDMTVSVTRQLDNGTYRKYTQVVTWDSEYVGDWFYFKAGVYNQNNAGDDYAQASFYNLEVSHDSN